ncbi:MAG: HD domain-containing protein [Clostridia bacterium]|nr:HD domain-containing protein [Clostridia bacterium]
MNRTENLAETLNKVFGNKKFILSLMNGLKTYTSEVIEKRLSKVLCYYIATKDSRTNYSYQEIELRSKEIYSEFRDTASYKHIIENGVLTHAFNGSKRHRLEKYGFNYMNLMPGKEKRQVEEMRKKLEFLEGVLGKSTYAISSGYNAKLPEGAHAVFVSSPGTKTIHYTLKKSPERFYLGPAKQSSQEGMAEPIVVGETKKTYIMRVLKNKIDKKISDKKSIQYIKAIEAAKALTEYYCSNRPAFVLLSMEKLKNVNIGYKEFHEGNTYVLNELIKWNMPRIRLDGFFTDKAGDADETNNFENLVIASNEIPNEAIIGIVEMMDEFEMKQLFARKKGLKIGDLMYENCFYKGEPNIEQLMGTITPEKTLEELEEIYRKFLKIKTENVKKIDDLKNQLNEVFLRSFSKRDGAKSSITLKEAISKLEQTGKLSELLKQDEEICMDDQQFPSFTHGFEHTRRVNFLATILMEMEDVTGRERDIIFQIAKNHDIGRFHDWEDEIHGYRSARKLEDSSHRLQDFTREEQELIKFVISQHSISSKENTRIVADLPDEIQEKYAKILWLFTDADKLDRVRLEPTGRLINVGLNISRLSLDSSKTLEGFAYETYDKLFDVLDIYKQLSELEQECNLERQVEFEKKLDNAIATRKSKKNKTIGRLSQRAKNLRDSSLIVKTFPNIKAGLNRLFNKDDDDDER